MRALLASLLAALAVAAPAAAAPTAVEVGRFDRPVHVTSPPGDPRVFVVEQRGRVRIAGGGVFLDVTTLVATGGEQGLLSIAFAPDYASSGRFFAFVTARADGALRVLEYRRSGTDPDRADPGSVRTVLSIPHEEAANHNGGQLAFGPDGMLYVGTGDGGNGNDAPRSDAEVPGSLLGKILRLDPATRAPAAGNPFGTAVWAYGLRNPWRFSFDRGTGDLVIGDVGQGVREEINFSPAAAGGGRGANFGWRCFEGTIPTPSGGGTLCSPGERPANTTPPVLEHPHANGFASITGGVVVRDPALPTLNGRYLYGDLAKPRLRSAVLAPGQAVGDREEATLAVAQPTSFGEDACGRVYVTSLQGGVYRIQDGAPAPCEPDDPGPDPEPDPDPQPPAPDPEPPTPEPDPQAPAPDTDPTPPVVTTPSTPASPPGPATPPDARRPQLSVKVAGLRRASRTRRLRLRTRCDEPCRIVASGRLRGVGRLRGARHALPAGRRVTVTLRLGKPVARRLRRMFRRRDRVVVALSVRATDAAGNVRRSDRRARIRG